MRKLLLTCSCKQDIQVPRSALGTIGKCPACGGRLEITAHTTRPLPKNHDKSKRDWKILGGSGGFTPPEDARQRFGQAVDLYYAKRHAEALAVFDALASEFPGNPDIQAGREQCLIAMKRPALGTPDPTNLIEQTEITEETVKRIILDKLLNAESEAVQLHAAELAMKLLGMGVENKSPQQSTQTAPPEVDHTPDPSPVTPSGNNAPATASGKNGHTPPPINLDSIFDEPIESDAPAPIE